MKLETQLLVLEFSRAIKDVLIVYVWFLEKVQRRHWRKFVQLLKIIWFGLGCLHGLSYMNKLYVLLLSLGEEVSEEEEIRGRVSVREIKLKEWVREALSHSFTHSPKAFSSLPFHSFFHPTIHSHKKSVRGGWVSGARERERG